MTEADLLQLDFTCVDEIAENSGAPNNFHYYTYDIGTLCLITPASDEVKNDEWYVELFESSNIRFTSRTELEIFITLLINNYTEE
jgi:hypothetical protein